MSADLQQSRDGNALARGLMLPYIVMRDFLEKETVTGLLDHALSHQSDFAPTLTYRSKAVDSSYRVSMCLRDLGKFRQVLQTKIFDLLPRFVTELRTMPVEEPKFETELVAHGDGAFYKRHIDTESGQDIKQYRVLNGVYYHRVLSGVYYFNAEPKAFTGGALRLHAIGNEECKSFVDIEPTHNSLLVFLAWAPHEVLPVSCPSKRFIDSRFAINCWVNGRKEPPRDVLN